MATATTTDKRDVLSVIHWILMVLMCLSGAAKLGTKWGLIHNLQYDDAYTIMAMLLSIAYDIAATYQIRAGAGELLPGGPSSDFVKDTYISEIFYVFSICFTRMIILQMLSLLSRNSTRRMTVFAAMGFNVIWGIVMMFAVAFQCRVPRSWDFESADCFNQSKFWTAFAALDALIDLIIGGLSVILFYDMNMSRKVKVPVIFAFSSRVFLLPIIVLRLIYQRKTLRSANRPYDDFSVVLLTSVHVNLGVLLTCVPFLKPVINGAQSGILAGDIRSLDFLDTDYLFTRSKDSKPKSDNHELTNMQRRNELLRAEAQGREGSQEHMIIRQTREVDVSSWSVAGEIEMPGAVFRLDR